MADKITFTKAELLKIHDALGVSNHEALKAGYAVSIEFTMLSEKVRDAILYE